MTVLVLLIQAQYLPISMEIDSSSLTRLSDCTLWQSYFTRTLASLMFKLKAQEN